MAASPELAEMQCLTRKYYARLRELLDQIPPERLSWRSAAEHLAADEALLHVCEADVWYVALIERRPGETPASGASHEELRVALSEAEGAMLAFLESMDEAGMGATAEVPGWWGEGKPQSARLILMHSLAHKYYHCGQLQAILHALAGQRSST